MLINVIEYFEKYTLNQYANKTAVIDGDKSIDFITLNRSAKSLASRIIKLSSQVNKPIAVLIPKSLESIIANLAITYSGNIYMNLDVKNPDTRIQNILKKIDPVIIITNYQFLEKAKSICSTKTCILNIDETAEEIADDNFLFKRLESIIDTDPYCIINTSGSTGTPKGVVLNHKSFIDFIEWSVPTLSIKQEEVIGSLSPMYFDIYSFEVCLLMAKAATIVILPEGVATFPAKLLEALQDKNVSWIFWVPTVMVNIANLNLLAVFKLASLKTVWFAGEVFPTKHLNYWRQYLPATMFVNLYGPIEITLDCTYYIVDKDLPDDFPIPIGYPCRNTDVLILNDEDALAAVNEKGELCVRGTSLALGYYNDPEKTAKAFVQNPLNKNYPEIIYRTGDIVYRNEVGEINFIGRKDFQIKHLGYRIDLSEVEHIIVNSWGKIQNACVAYNQNNKEICLFYESKTELQPSEFRKQLAAFMPKYMIPTSYHLFNELPRNANGKIDRLKLISNFINEVSA